MDPAVVADLRLAFNAIDANGNGVLSRAEVHCYTYYGAIHTMECTPPCILYTLPPHPTPPHCPPRPITTTISSQVILAARSSPEVRRLMGLPSLLHADDGSQAH